MDTSRGAADPKFHAVVDEHRRNGYFVGLDKGTPEYNARLKEVAVAFVGVVNEKRVTLFRNRGILNGRKGEFREAISCYNRGLELSRNSPSKHVTLANRSAAYIKRQQFAEALRDAQEAAVLCADYSIAHSLMGYCHSRLGLDKKAVVNYHMALELNPMDVSSQSLLAEAKKSLLAAGETPEAVDALEAPFVSKSARNQEEAAIEAAVAAALEMPVKHRRYLDHTGRAASIEAMVRLARKLSSGAQALASLTQLPGKLKHTIGKKARGQSTSSSRGVGLQHSPPMGSDFAGLFRDDSFDGVPAPRSAAPTPGTSAAPPSTAGKSSSRGVPQEGSNPLFNAGDVRRLRYGLYGGPGNASGAVSRVSSAPDVRLIGHPRAGGGDSGGVVGGGEGGEGGGGGDGGTAGSRHVGGAGQSAAGGRALRSSVSGGGATDPDTRGGRQLQHQQKNKQQNKPRSRGASLEATPRTAPAKATGDRRPGAHTSLARQLEDMARRKDATNRRQGEAAGGTAGAGTPAGTATAAGDAGREQSKTFVQSARADGDRAPLVPRAAPVRGGNSEPDPSSPVRKPDKNETPATTVQVTGKPSRLVPRPSWVPEKSGYASSESSLSEGGPMCSKEPETVTAATSMCGAGGDDDRAQQSVAVPTVNQTLHLEAAANGKQQWRDVVARSQGKIGWTTSDSAPEKAGWTTSDSSSDAEQAEREGERRGEKERSGLPLDSSATSEVVVREDGVEADGALRRMLDGDSDCGSVLPLQDNSMEGEKRPRRLEGKHAQGGRILQEQQVERQKPARTQRVGAQVPGGEEGITRSPRGTSEARDSTDGPPDGGGQSKEPAASATTAVGACEVTSSTLGGTTPRDPKSPTALSKSVSVRAKIEMFERTARSAAGEEGRNRSSSLGTPAACHRQPLGRSLSAKASAREWAFSASVDRSQQRSAVENGGLARALSFSSSSRLARGGATPGFVANTADPPILPTRELSG
ncbi:conserved unknown protein [Ectocarpus siliculosus]|uniref:Uncharacterized protein n=1 Tax=Ectocarpus siliculosus TaxID=2880 RepID=D7FGT4_ECTSI|nr:conserved unknown protein [Ectocarpus siliculosus]|eukprot:CBJ28360.1 conserved unknown protein [Ectocarpus siliculosus]